MKGIICVLAVLTGFILSAQNTLNIVPLPAEVKMGKGTFAIDKNTIIVLEGSGLEK